MSIKDKNEKNHFGKNFFTRYVEDRCDRQLFLKLCQNNPNWMDPKRKIVKLKRPARTNNYILNLGHSYEQLVYKYLIKSLKTKYTSEGSTKSIGHTILNRSNLNEISKEINDGKSDCFILLENEFQMPLSLMKFIFPPKNPKDPIPVEYSAQRPDIILIRKTPKEIQNEEVYELLPNGNIHKLTKKEKELRLSINIIDIKNTIEQDIGKKHFIEIMLYLMAFSNFIYEKKMEKKFFISLGGNGIFPKISEDLLKKIKNLNDFLVLIVNFPWKESNRIFSDTIKKLRELHNLSPCSIESIAVNIQPKCGFCPFLEDCKISLGMHDLNHPENWSLKLIPFNSMSMSQQLESYGFKTIGDVAKGLSKIKIGNTPAPLYPELPLLGMKVNSLINNKIITPKPGEVHSYCIPKFTPIALTFAIETDPSSNRVFAVGFYLKMSIAKNAKNYGIFKNWWKIWNDALNASEDPKTIKSRLDHTCFPTVQPIPLEIVEKFLNYLKVLKNFKIFLPGMVVNGKKTNQTRVLYAYADINESLEPDKEDELAIRLINSLFPILEICNIVEMYVKTSELRHFRKKNGKYKDYIIEYKADMGIFYWSKSQIEHLQEMLERNIQKLISKKSIWNKFSKLISWFTPSESEVTHPYQHKKIFNLRAFIETIIGFPGIINYTWHEIAKHPSNAGLNSNKLFWIEHYNYMDPTPWYNFLQAKGNISEQDRIRAEIIKQITHKTRTLNNLRQKFQYQTRYAISANAQPVKSSVIKERSLDDNFHSLAQVWYLYSQLSGTIQDLEANNIRTVYPEYSIGKLNAARVINLYQISNPLGKPYIFQFTIQGLSSNMKINEGDHALLIPDELRDLRKWELDRNWKVIINKMIWNSKLNGYLVQVSSKEDLLMLYDKEVDNKPDNPIWYLFPTSLDAWTNKLYGLKAKGLLERKKFGISWLGARLAFLWDIRTKNSLYWPKSWDFSSNEVYIYLPKILENIKGPPNNQLLTNIDPVPDDSQAESIKKALNNVIHAIIGPPGTGKSQTIVSLIDEFVFRSELNEKSTKILVTSFSYAALRVIIDKIRKSKNKFGKKSKVANLQLVFLRSESQDPISDNIGCSFVNDLVRMSNGSWRWNGETNKITNQKPLEDQLMDNFIIFGNAHQLFRLTERTRPTFKFDLIIVDEASQLPTDYFLSSLQYIKNQNFHIQPVVPPKIPITPNLLVSEKEHIRKMKLLNPVNINNLTKVVIVGDYNQLPPVQPILPPKNLEKVLDSLFAYYVKHHEIKTSQLKVNYRSHQDIVDFTKTLGIYEGLRPSPLLANETLEGDIKKVSKIWIQEILSPNKVVCSIIHKRKFEIAVSSLEAKLVSEIVIGYYEMCDIKSKEEESEFWNEKLGVVAPHNAQGRLIIHDIFEKMTTAGSSVKSHLKNSELMLHLKSTVYSVEKFQGSDRELIITSVGLSDTDQISAEEEFIYDLNRFNVLTSRAKKKIIYICSESFVNFIPNDRDIMKHASHSYYYVHEFCNREKVIFIKNEKDNLDYVYFRWRENTPKIEKPLQSYNIKSNIDGDFFEIIYTPNDEFESMLQGIPKNIFNQKMETTDKSNKNRIWRFKIRDVPELSQWIVIPDKIKQEFLFKFGQKPDSNEENKTDIEKGQQIKKTQKKEKKKSKEINIDYGDDDEESLF
ncbi:MAG: AAA domain-containing protein [Promethearchaeota archaeon]